MKITPALVLNAYTIGMFPMAQSRLDDQIYWVDPQLRAHIPLDEYHFSKSLKKTIRKQEFQVTFNKAFEDVIIKCGSPHIDRPDSWINDEIEDLYIQLHYMGFAHSVEVWRDKKLIGGLYGVSLGSLFFGESMFSREANGSKIAMVYLISRLRRTGFQFLDTQFVNEHLKQFGVVEISKNEYLENLNLYLKTPCQFDVGTEESFSSVEEALSNSTPLLPKQEITQTS